LQDGRIAELQEVKEQRDLPPSLPTILPFGNPALRQAQGILSEIEGCNFTEGDQ
jgi:hypothetical protein